MKQTLRRLSQSVAKRLAEKQTLLVLAESCTAGLVAAALGGVPGISRHFCGSAVTYQEATKQAWLDVPAEILAQEGAVSERVAALMAEHVLRKTPQASVSAAITGHLGPAAPVDLDGVIYIAISWCIGGQPASMETVVRRIQLEPANRTVRQQMAAKAMLAAIEEHLDAS